MIDNVSAILDLLHSGIERNLYSGAQIVVSSATENIMSFAVGKTHSGKIPYLPASKVTEDTLFDIASMTKPLSTAALYMIAVQEGDISLDTKLVSVPGIEFPPWMLGDTIEQLLSHRTMLPAWVDLLNGAAARADDHRQARDYVMREIAKIEPRQDGKTWCYTDLGYILLGFILETAYGTSLDKLFQDKIASRLGLCDEMCFLPLHRRIRNEIAATGPCGKSFALGHPDDSNARVLTHVAGHAGLFATAKGVARYVRALLSGCFPCQSNIIHDFLNYHHPETPYALGWDRPTTTDSLSGRNPGDHVIGHLGFTGCSVWIDLDTKRSIILLTNRVHVNHDTSSLADFRRRIHRLCWEL